MNRRRIRRLRSIEAEGFYHGSQGVSHTHVLAQITAQIGAEKEWVKERVAKAAKRIEAGLAIAGDRLAEAQARRDALEAELGDERPGILLPLAALMFASLAIYGEVLFLAPVMDGFGIANPVTQLITAGVLVLVSSGLVDLLIRQLRAREITPAGLRRGGTLPLLLFGALGVFVASFLILIGWFRADEMLFAASLRGGELGAFLTRSPAVTHAVVALLTVGLPVFAAVTFEWAFDRLGWALEWRSIRRTLRREGRRIHKLRMRHEGNDARLVHRMVALSHEECRLRYFYLENHELGRNLGARQQALIWVIVKTAGLTALLAAACVMLDPIVARYLRSSSQRILFDTFVVAGAAALYLVHAIRAWERPTPRQVYRNRAPHFRAADISLAERAAQEKRRQLMVTDGYPQAEFHGHEGAPDEMG